MPNPFRYDDPLPEAEQIGRERERDRLVDLCLDGRNSRLTAPRRFGKTSLVRAALAKAHDAGLTVVYVNFLGVVTVQDVVDRIDRAYGEHLDGALRSFWKSIQATLSAAPAGVGISVTSRTADPQLLDRLALPRRIGTKTGARVAVAFDEFQEVARVADALPGVFRSEIEQHGDAVAYTFCGSHPGMMRDLFAARRHAFFAQATPIPLPPLGVAETITTVAARFREHDRDAGEALDALVATAAGHPQRTMLLAHHLFAHTAAGSVAGPEQWSAALHDAERHVDDEVHSAWDALSDVERRVVVTVADGTVALQGQAAAAAFGIVRGSSTTAAAQRLVADGSIEPDDQAPSGYRVVDPMLGRWLRAGRRWPA
ncbi:MAG: hypothetical protein M0P31_17915 [Solirubrobacteraceae bacterium]|nr:hypothetical protein [Solirubrobacteraceae bacterium]